jgi:hypothetical protein
VPAHPIITRREAAQKVTRKNDRDFFTGQHDSRAPRAGEQLAFFLSGWRTVGGSWSDFSAA